MFVTCVGSSKDFVFIYFLGINSKNCDYCVNRIILNESCYMLPDCLPEYVQSYSVNVRD